MATVVQSAATGHRVIYVKGAPEIVMSLCTSVAGRRTPEQINALLLDYQKQAMRTLGFAYAVIPDSAPVPDLSQLAAHKSDIGLEFIGVTAISDPVRREVPEAVKECLSAGIK